MFHVQLNLPEHKAYNHSTFFTRQISLGKHTASSTKTDENIANNYT